MSTDINPELKARLDKIEAIRADLKSAEATASKDVMDLLKDMMKSNPLLVAFRWQQYTPGFNDGEPCTFDIHGPYYKFADNVVPEKESDYNDGFCDDWQVSRNDGEFFTSKSDVLNFEQIEALKKTVDNVGECFGHLQAMEAQLEDMFGDGYEITVTADGVEVEDYSHD